MQALWNSTTTIGRKGSPRLAALTLIELIVVIGILSVIFTIALPQLSGIGPKYKLRAQARRLASQLESIRLAAITRQRWMGMRYVLEPTLRDLPYYQVVPPAPDDNPHQAIEDRELRTPTEFEYGVRITRVLFSGNDAIDGGECIVLFSPNGNTGSHIVMLEDASGRKASLKFNCMTGIMEFAETDELRFAHFEE